MQFINIYAIIYNNTKQGAKLTKHEMHKFTYRTYSSKAAFTFKIRAAVYFGRFDLHSALSKRRGKRRLLYNHRFSQTDARTLDDEPCPACRRNAFI